MKISWVHSWGVYIAKGRLARKTKQIYQWKLLTAWDSGDMKTGRTEAWWVRNPEFNPSAGRGSAKRNGETCVFSRLCLRRRWAVIESETEHGECEFTATKEKIPDKIFFNSLCIPVQCSLPSSGRSRDHCQVLWLSEAGQASLYGVLRQGGEGEARVTFLLLCFPMSGTMFLTACHA